MESQSNLSFYILKSKRTTNKPYLKLFSEIKQMLKDEKFDKNTKTTHNEKYSDAIFISIKFVSNEQKELFISLLKNMGLVFGNVLINA